MGPHRADVKGPDGVLEIQRSAIAIAEIREREQFYGRMIWLLNGRDFWHNLEWLGAKGDMHSFRWKHARKTWLAAQKPLLFDTPWGLLRVKSINQGHWTFVNGVFIQPDQLMKFLDRSESTRADEQWRDEECVLALQRTTMMRYAVRLKELRDWYQRARQRTEWNVVTLCSQGLIPTPLPRWLAATSIYEWLATVPAKDALQSIREWDERREKIKAFLEEEERQRVEAIEKYRRDRDQREWERLERERNAELALQQATRISREKYEQELARQADERRCAELAKKAEEGAARLIQQSQELALEWRRGALISEFLSWRDAPVGGFGRLETAFIESCVQSLQAAGKRGNITQKEFSVPRPLSERSQRCHQPLGCAR